MEGGYLFSIGHGNKTIEELIDALMLFGIKYLIDVRSKPFSKFYPQFNKDSLNIAINLTGDIHYGYMGDQIGGLPEDETLKTGGKMDYGKMRQNPNFIFGINRLIKANEMNLPTCIMCSEGNPSECHRSKLIGEALRDKGIIMKHICKNHEGKYVLKSQIDVINEVSGGCMVDLFGEELNLTSRKTY